jgi:hypothetical protein
MSVGLPFSRCAVKFEVTFLYSRLSWSDIFDYKCNQSPYQTTRPFPYAYVYLFSF